MRSKQEVYGAMERYADTVRRICALCLKNASDTEDIFQEVFLKYALRSAPFESAEHEKAWLIRVTINRCKDVLKNVFRSRTVPIDEAAPLPARQAGLHSDVLEAVLALPEWYRNVIYLHYFEGDSAVEMGKLFRRNVNTVYTLLARARRMLQVRLGGEEDA